MKKIIPFILMVFAIYIYWQNSNTNKIKPEWKDTTKFTKNFTVGLLTTTIIYMCNKEGDPSRSTLSNSINYVYKNIEPTTAQDKEVAICFKKVLSKFTPQDVIQDVFINTNKDSLVKAYADSIK